MSTKTVMLTGGASGIALLAGTCYAKEGYNVVLVDINEDALNKVKESLSEYGDRILVIRADVTKYEDAVMARDKAVEVFSTIDILICCAGGAETRLCNQGGNFWEIPIETYDFGIDLNLKGAIYFDHAVMAQMVKQNSGVIIHLGSITGAEGSSAAVAYAASKSALMHGVTKSIALAGAPYNIRCVCIAPGPVLTRDAMANMKTLIGRAADTQEIVDLIMYVASEKGAFINGTCFLADGGRYVMYNK
ncbi:MAG: SDR family NAD(P)-dependent oxidoreductase [Clostridia bacterium]|nr:SDR family NAD(P)-dependent oxidoreductase [Clostridia bacterium]